jgi:hypothetical protein
MSAFLLTYLGTLIDDFSTFGEVGGGAKWIQPPSQFHIQRFRKPLPRVQNRIFY